MRIGEYHIVIENMDGQILAEVERTAATGHPAVGEEIVLEGAVYVVERVRHEEEAAGRTRRRYTWPRLFVRKHGGLVREPHKEPVRAPPRVLPFAPGRPRGRLQSVVLPPSLLAVLVACGYDLQSRYFARRSRGGARLLRLGQGWFVEAGESPSEALVLAREARQQRRRMEGWIEAEARRLAESPWQSSAIGWPSGTVGEGGPADYPRGDDRPRSDWRFNDGAACFWPAAGWRRWAASDPPGALSAPALTGWGPGAGARVDRGEGPRPAT
jgi:hypothetical protein